MISRIKLSLYFLSLTASRQADASFARTVFARLIDPGENVFAKGKLEAGQVCARMRTPKQIRGTQRGTLEGQNITRLQEASTSGATKCNFRE